MPIQRTSSMPVRVQNAITLASRRTGASFDYLVNTARRESAFRAHAKSGSSSAEGLFQFVEGTWLKVVKEDGDRLGLGNLAKNIHRTSSGKYYVPNRGRRREILALRRDPETAALVAAAYTEHNERYVRHRIGRTPSDGELYLAHFLGPGSAAKMIRLAESHPDSPASRYFPAAAKANKSIFYKNGRPRSLAEVHQILVSSHVDDQDTGVRRSGSSAFSFGIMGDLLADTRSPSRHTGRHQEGSIGVWEDLSKPAAASGKKSSTRHKAGTEATNTGTSQTAERARHQAASDHYRTASKTVGKTSDSAKWIQDAFGG